MLLIEAAPFLFQSNRCIFLLGHREIRANFIRRNFTKHF